MSSNADISKSPIASRRGSSSSTTTSIHRRMKTMKRGTQCWDEMVQPFCSDLVFRCLRRHRTFSKVTFESWSGHAAVLLVDLSGYSRITSVLSDRGAYLLSKIVNGYFAELLRVVQLFGGDVVKFAGDAVIVVWESESVEEQELNVLCAAYCALQMQELAGDYPIEGTDLSFRIHCGLSCGQLDTEVFVAPSAEHMQRLYHVVSGEPLVELGDLVQQAKAGEVCVSLDCVAFLQQYAVFEDDSGSGKLLRKLVVDPDTDDAVDRHINSLHKHRSALRSTKVEERFIHPSVLDQLQHAGTQIAQMRHLCVLFIAKTSSGNSANWLMEVFHVLDKYRCPIVQILDDDKGVHLTAAVNLHESVPEATTLALNASRELISKQVGCSIGMAMGGTYCGITGSDYIACRWDITGAPVVRAARLMQYALANNLPIAIDESVYDNATFSTMLERHSTTKVKGCPNLVTVYKISESKSVAASMILENFAFSPIHQGPVKILEEFLTLDNSRGAAVITGPSLVGKKVVCQRAAGLAKMVPILHVGDATGGLFQIGNTLCDWFLHYHNEQCVKHAREVKDHIEHHRFSQAHDQCLKLVDTVIASGYRGCIVVDHVHDLDQFSYSFIRTCLVHHRLPRRSSSFVDGSIAPVAPVYTAKVEKGKFFFLCTHEPLYHSKPVSLIVTELVRAHRLVVPIVTVSESTREELQILVRDSIDLGVDDGWLDVNAETSGFRCGYMIQRIRKIRILSANLSHEGKTPLSTIADDLKLHVPLRMSRHVRAVTVDKVGTETAMRFGRVFDELPPSFQTFVEVVAVATGSMNSLFMVPLKPIAMAMEDLFVPGDDTEMDSFPIDIAIAELEDLFILKVDGEADYRRISLRCPAFRDVAATVCTPARIEAIAAALIDRFDQIDDSKTFVDQLLIAGLAGRLGDVAVQHSQWKLALSELTKESSHLSETTINLYKELLEEQIENAGCSPEKVLAIESLGIERAPLRCLDPTSSRLKYYSGPLTFGPLGHSLSVISRNCFKEQRAYRGATQEETTTLRHDISSGVSRCRRQIDTVEAYLDYNGFGISQETKQEELEILDLLTKPATGEDCSRKKADLFLNRLVPNHVEPRIGRLRCHVAELRARREIPAIIAEADDAVRLAFQAMHKEGHRSDAVQSALVTLASLHWAPKKVPECLPVFFYQTVATIRYRLVRRQLSDAELLLFRHQYTADDLEAFLLVSALLPEHDLPRVI